MRISSHSRPGGPRNPSIGVHALLNAIGKPDLGTCGSTPAIAEAIMEEATELGEGRLLGQAPGRGIY
jgi:hypothetical protein